MLVIPAIDLHNGRCVRLKQGQASEVTVYNEDPVQVAREFAKQGARLIHMVDLDGAFRGHSANLDAVQNVVQAVSCPIELGGGIRSMQDVERVLNLGVARVILGTAAVENPDLAEQAAARYGEQVVVGIDAKNGKVAVKGWVETSRVDALDLALEMKDRGIKEIIYTDVARDGMLTGPNLKELRRMTQAEMSVIASGGVASLDDLRALRNLEGLGVRGVIVGKAIYEGRFTVADAIQVLSGEGQEDGTGEANNSLS